MNDLIVIVEDQVKLAATMSKYLEASGFDTQVFHDGKGVIDYVKDNAPCLVVLDLMLPGVDGLTLCTQIRQFSNVPIIIVTAKTEEIDRLLGLELGADDYICKPFSQRELVARVKVILRRMKDQTVSPAQSPTLTLNEHQLLVSYGERSSELTVIEFKILQKMTQNPGRIYRREDLLDSAYTDGRDVSDRAIDSHISKIRRKLADISPGQKYIHSIYSLGYKFEPA